MFSTLKKLGHKRKLHRKEKSKKNKETLNSNDKLKSTAKSTFDIYADSMPPFNPARRHSCFSAFMDVPTESLRRGSIASQGSTGSAPSFNKGRRGSTASTCSTTSAESYRAKRLVEIAQLDKYVENLKKSADPDNLSYLPNRLCVALLLKSVLQRREQQYMYEYLHSNRSSSESEISHKYPEDSPNLKRHPAFTSSDFNNNDENDDDNNHHSNNKIPTLIVDDVHARPPRRHIYQKKSSPKLEAKNVNSDLSSRNIDTTDENTEEEGSDISRKEEEPEERVPGALLKAYELEHSERLADSDTEMDVSKHHRYKKKTNSNTRRRSISVFPNNFEIY